MYTSSPSLSSAFCGELERFVLVLDRLGNSGARVAGRASTNRIHYHERGARGVLQLGIDFLSGAHFFDAELCELLAHRTDESFIVHLIDLLLANDYRRKITLRITCKGN